MRNYTLKISFKTFILNQIRKIFTLKIFEKLLLKLFLKNQSLILKKIIPPDYLFKKGSFRFINRNGISYKLDISNVVDHYLYWGFKENSYDSIIDDIKKSKIIFDIGANIGTTSLFFSSINKDAQIYAFEPHPNSFKRAVDNFNLNNINNISIFNFGLGDQKNSFKLYEVNNNNAGMNRILTKEMDLPYVNINVDVLDNFVEENNILKLDFVKIDVEGYEYSVLQGGQNTIIKYKPILFIELDDDNLRENNKSAKDLILLLKSFGYNEIYHAEKLKKINEDDNFLNCHFDIIAK